MTITEWRKNPELCAWAAKLFRGNNWKLLMEVMAQSHVRHGQLQPIGPSEVDCSRQLGKIEGWDIYQATMDSAAIEVRQEPVIEASFESPQIETKAQ